MKLSAPIHKLSAPIYRLKRQARLLSREKNIPIHKTLDQIAADEGFVSWSQLAARFSEQEPAKILINELKPGDLVLLAGRPGQGKTLLGLELALEAIKTGNRAAFFSLEYNTSDISKLIAGVCNDSDRLSGQIDFDTSDDICADYVTYQFATAHQGTVVVIDYLQLLDQKRANSDLEDQVQSLKFFAEDRGLTIIILSQIHRDFETTDRAIPDLSDVRLPNPLDLSLFNKACFVNDGFVHFAATS